MGSAEFAGEKQRDQRSHEWRRNERRDDNGFLSTNENRAKHADGDGESGEGDGRDARAESNNGRNYQRRGRDDRRQETGCEAQHVSEGGEGRIRLAAHDRLERRAENDDGHLHHQQHVGRGAGCGAQRVREKPAACCGAQEIGEMMRLLEKQRPLAGPIARKRTKAGVPTMKKPDGQKEQCEGRAEESPVDDQTHGTEKEVQRLISPSGSEANPKRAEPHRA